jgi:type VI secretion system protein ImpK
MEAPQPGAKRASARITSPEVAKPRLVDLASDTLSTALALGRIAELPDANALRARALELKSRFEREAAAHGFVGADVEDAVFAMVAFLDETILNAKGAAREVWIARPLQLELYGRQLAGEEFFERLEKLRHEREARIEALEVYACCLAFGFAGRYRLFPERLPELHEEVLRDVSAVRGSGALPLAPNAGRRNERVVGERRGMPWWMPALAFLVATVLAWLVIGIFAYLGASRAAQAIANLAR